MPEKTNHKIVKRIIDICLSELGFTTIGFEIGHADVLCCWREYDLATEYERSIRNVIRNLERNFVSGADFHLIVTPDFRTLRDIAAKLQKELPHDYVHWVGLMTLPTLKLLAAKQFPLAEATAGETRLKSTTKQNHKSKTNNQMHDL